MAVKCAILSYNGTVYFGFSGDAHAAPDLRRLEKLLQECFADLKGATGLRPPKKKNAIKKRRVSATVTTDKNATAPAPVSRASVGLVQPKRMAEPALPAPPDKALTQLIVA